MNVRIILVSNIVLLLISLLCITLCSSVCSLFSSVCLSLLVIRYSSSNRQKCEHRYLGKRMTIRGLLEGIFVGCSNRKYYIVFIYKNQLLEYDKRKQK
jgi:hypothetical protein